MSQQSNLMALLQRGQGFCVWWGDQVLGVVLRPEEFFALDARQGIPISRSGHLGKLFFLLPPLEQQRPFNGQYRSNASQRP